MSSTTDPGDRSSAQIERDVEQTRAQLSETLDDLREQVSPSHLMDQAVEYLRSSGGAEFTRNLGRVVRDNPVPLLLIGAGIGWLALSSRSSDGHATHTYRAPAEPLHGGTYPPSAYPPATGTATAATTAGVHTTHTTHTASMHRGNGHEGPSMSERAGSAASDAAGRVGGAARDAADRVGSTASSAADRISGAASQVGEAASHAYDSVAGAVGSAAERARAAAGSMSHRAGDMGHGLRDHADRTREFARQAVGWVVNDQPLVLGGIGLAVGAAIGALLPRTRTEDRMMGEASDFVTRQARSVAQEGYERAQEVAGHTLERARATAADTYDSAKERLDEAGLSPSKVGEALSGVAQEVRETAQKGIHEAADEVRDAMHKGEQEADKAMSDKTSSSGTSSSTGSSPGSSTGSSPGSSTGSASSKGAPGAASTGNPSAPRSTTPGTPPLPRSPGT